MANVSFKRGLQSSIDTILKNKTSVVEGAFYLTTDTNRLYFAQSKNELVHLNQYVIHVASLAALPKFEDAAIGDFYYVEDDNILCTKRNSETAWTQINKNTDTDTYLIAAGTEFKAGLTDKKEIQIEYTLAQQTTNYITGKNTESEAITGSFIIPSSVISGATTEVAVDIKADADANNGIIHIENEGAGADATDDKGFDLHLDGSLSTFKDSDGNIVIKGENTTYTLSSAANSTIVSLLDKETSAGTVEFKAGTGLTVSGANAGAIEYSHATVDTTPTSDKDTLTYSDSFSVIDSLDIVNGHIEGYNKKEITLPEKITYTFSNPTANNLGQISFNVNSNGANNVIQGEEQSIFFKLNEDSDPIYNQGNLNVYTRDEVDSKLQGLDAMRFMGVLGAGNLSDLPSEKVSNGDTYKVGTEGTYNGVSAGVGDLFIAYGEENVTDEDADSYGYLEEITWHHIPAGDDLDSQYTIKAVAGGGIALVATNGLKQVINTISFTSAEDNKIGIDRVNEDDTLRLSHAAPVNYTGKVTDTKTLIAKDSFVAISAIDVDGTGHVSKWTEETYTLPKDTQYELGANASSKSITLTEKDADVSSAVSFVEGKQINIDVQDKAFTIKHADISTTVSKSEGNTTIGEDRTFVAIDGLSITNGHVDGYSTKTYALPQDKDTTYTFSQSVGIIEGVATLTSAIVGTDGSTSADQVCIKSDHLTITATNKNDENNTPNTLNINLEWGTF